MNSFESVPYNRVHTFLFKKNQEAKDLNSPTCAMACYAFIFRLLLKGPSIMKLVPSIKFNPLYLFFSGTITNLMPFQLSKFCRRSVCCNQNLPTVLGRKSIATIDAFLRTSLFSTYSLLEILFIEILAGSKELGHHSISKVKYDQAVAMNSALVSLRIL